MNTSSSYEGVDYGNPESFFVFVVGNCEEWPENREEQGDIALYKEYLASGVPPDQVLFLKDKQANYANCNKKLSTFLQQTRPHTTLVFSYGGHGKPTGFSTRKREWPYRDILQMIERLFQGERVLFLLDCCASGNVGHCLCLLHPVPTKQYVVLASSPAFVTTSDEGEEWILNHRWMLGMRCNDGNLPLHCVIDCLSDQTALVLGDQFTTFISEGVDCTKGDWMPRRPSHEVVTTYRWNRLEHRIPKDARVTEKYSIGDQVFYKHMGGPIDAGLQYLPPGWFAGTILSEGEDGSVQLEVGHPVMTHLKWNVQAPRQKLINHLYMSQMWMLQDEFEEAQCVLAKNMKYLDYSIKAGTLLKVVGLDGEVQSARVLDWRLFDWETYLDEEQCDDKPPFGPHVPVQWLHKDETELIPVQSVVSPNITVQPFIDSFESIQGDEEEWARRALVCSIESSGKTICNASEAISGKLKAYWPEDGEWYDVEPMDPSRVSLWILATHAEFVLTGSYCPLAYEDGDFYLSPLFYVQKR